MGADRAMALQIHNNHAPYFKKKSQQSVIGSMTWRWPWVGSCRIAVMILSLGALIGCDVNSALERVSEARHLLQTCWSSSRKPPMQLTEP
jgi:hypothetical protein